MATRGRRRGREDPDEDEEAPPSRVTPVAAATAGATPALRKTATPLPGPADLDPDSITPEFLSDFNSKKQEIERIVESVK